MFNSSVHMTCQSLNNDTRVHTLTVAILSLQTGRWPFQMVVVCAFLWSTWTEQQRCHLVRGTFSCLCPGSVI